MGDEFDVKFEFKNTGGSPLEIMLLFLLIQEIRDTLGYITIVLANWVNRILRLES